MMIRKTTRVIFSTMILLLIFTYAQAGPVPDTGQTQCYDNSGEIPCPQPGEPFYGQDANYLINPPSFTKLDADGNDLPDTATSWTMVRDNVTGLIWEVKTDDGSVHDKDNTYTWYDSNPDTNGGNAGMPGDGTNTEDFINELNSSKYGGHSDWRLPSPEELQSIVDYGTKEPAINDSYFPNTMSSHYWSSNTYALYPGYAWDVYFGNGLVYGGSKWHTYYVRAVRAGQSGSFDNLVSNKDGTVTDTNTGLMWQQKTAGEMNWEASLSYCENLSLAGYSDWRLPTAKELASIVDRSKYNPAIDKDYFPDTMSSYYWSSTAYASYSDYARSVGFDYGCVGDAHGDKSNTYYVRAVRAGQSDIGSFDPLRIEFSPIWAQTVNIPFEVEISIRRGNFIATDINGPLKISTSVGRVVICDPRGVVLQNGKWIGNITMLDCTQEGVRLQAHGRGTAGQSSKFLVSGCEEPALGGIIGKVFDSEGHPFPGVLVSLFTTEEELIDEYYSDNYGNYSFHDLEPGDYKVEAKASGSFMGKTSVSAESIYTTLANDIIVHGHSLKPLLIVPGIMGSTSLSDQKCPKSSLYVDCAVPDMPKDIPAKPENLYILDPELSIGVRPVQLKEFINLFIDDYDGIHVPWDWRYDITLAWERYLKPKIDQAKKAYGLAKVDIVAHSMGGLLVRAYMQSAEYEHDIDKFVMLGTPNQGSSNTYIIEEGGDPKLVDEITGGKLGANFYYQTIKKEMKNQNKEEDSWEKPIEVRKYIADNVPTLNQLAPTYKKFLHDGTEYGYAKCSVNWFLEFFNREISSEIYSIDSTILFLSNNEETIATINVDSFPEDECPPSDEITELLYPSGEIIQKDESYIKHWSPGDGTVVATWAADPFLELDKNIVEQGNWGAHSKLFGNEDIQKKVYKFLTGKDLSVQTKKLSSKAILEAQQTETHVLRMSMKGNVQPSVVDYLGRKVGIDPATLTRPEEFGESRMSTFSGGSHLAVYGIDDGLYTVQLHGWDGSSFRVELVYSNDDSFVSEEITGYYESDITEFQVDLTQADSGKIIIPPLEAPTSVNSYEQEGNTIISWDIVLDPEVIGYRVYGKCPAWPDFRYLGSTVNDYFETGHAWNDSGDGVDWQYMVVAESATGVLSFYERTVRNRTPVFLIIDSEGENLEGRHLFAEPGQTFIFDIAGGSGDFEVRAEIDGEPVDDVIVDHCDGSYSFTSADELTARIIVKDLKKIHESYYLLDVKGEQTEILFIDTHKGWNLVSSRVNVVDVQDVFGGIDGIVSVWKWKNGGWAVLLPFEDTPGAYAASKGFEELVSLSPGDGFWVNTNQVQTLELEGPASSETPVSLTKGWNLKGLKQDSTVTANELINSIDESIISLWKWTGGGWAVYLPGQDDGGAAYAKSKGFSLLENVNPGEGFWVNAKQQITLD